jgi:hypothetical protein
MVMKWRLTGQLSLGEERIGETPTYDVTGWTVAEAEKEATAKWEAEGSPKRFYNGVEPVRPYSLFWRDVDY